VKKLYNPLDTVRRFRSRVGKPIRPIVEIQKNCSVVNVITTTVQTGNLINDAYRVEAWELPPDAKAFALYIDGIFKGMSYFAGEEGRILDATKEVNIQGPVMDTNGKYLLDAEGKPIMQKINFAAKGILGALFDAELYKLGSALKPSMMQTLIYCALFGGFMFMAGMSYA
jgi:hypothetical protein